MNRKSFSVELFLLSTAIGIVVTFAAPWVELRSTYAAWQRHDRESKGQDAFAVRAWL